MRIVTVVGARPQFIKAAVVSRAIRRHNRVGGSPRIREILVHTGQHYDYLMSRVFFENLGIPVPDYNLKVGSGTHPWMIGTILRRIERVLLTESPDWVLVYGDTNSTLAGALAAAKLPLPVAHVEAGMRSGNREMPEETNRLLTDHLSSALFCPTRSAVDNLKKEGITRGVYRVGDVMYDAFLEYRDRAVRRSRILQKLAVTPKNFYLATVHRQENADDTRRLSEIFGALDRLATRDCPVIVPLHPRTRLRIREQKKDVTRRNRHLRLINPLGYQDMIALVSQARVILTDSGGVQKEAYFAGVPCVTLRNETEWVETVEAGWNILAGADSGRIVRALAEISGRKKRKSLRTFYGDGRAGQKIVENLVSLQPLDWRALEPAGKRMAPR
jgi:UDP-N-acetylglucosamine 2-epimerase